MDWVNIIQPALAIALLLAVALIVREVRRAQAQLDAAMEANLSPRAKHRYRRAVAAQHTTLAPRPSDRAPIVPLPQLQRAIAPDDSELA